MCAFSIPALIAQLPATASANDRRHRFGPPRGQANVALGELHLKNSHEPFTIVLARYDDFE
jgi:hypothetical protein